MRRILRGALGTLLASSVLGLTRPAAAQAPMTPIPPPAVENGQPAPKPIPPRSPDDWDKELRLPTIVPAKPQAAPSGGKSSDAKSVKPPPPLTKWGQPAMSWESQLQKKPTPATTGEALKTPTVKPATPDHSAEPAKKSKPVFFASEHQPTSSGNGSAPPASPALTVPVTPKRWQRPVTSEESKPRAEPKKKPTPPATTGDARKAPVVKPTTPNRSTEPAKKSKPALFASERQPASSSGGSASAPSPTLIVPVTPRRWQHPATSEESEPRAEPPTKPTKPTKPMTKLTKPATPPAATPAPVVRAVVPSGSASSGRVMTSAMPPVVPLDRPSRWPPAYEVQPKNGRSGVISFEDDGRPGAITFEDEPDPKSMMMANLKRQVQSVCGKQARDVFVEAQRDGNVLVKVRVANPSNEDRLTRKILTIPEMASPKVRLTMDVSP